MTAAESRGRRATGRLDLRALLLAPCGVAVVILAQAAAGVPVRTLLSIEAALIVFGGTLGAILLSYPPGALAAAVRAAVRTFRVPPEDGSELAAALVRLATHAHRRGLIAMEADLERIDDAFLREGVRSTMDEPSEAALRDMLMLESAARGRVEDAPARLFEAAAGYAPTLGILGAVLGLIDVMRNLQAPGALGGGIAVAFVATVYGVGTANLLLLPLAGRLREQASEAAFRRDMIVHALCAIHQRVHPALLAQKLRACQGAPDGTGVCTSAGAEAVSSVQYARS